MAILNFHKRFAEKVEAGTKQQTIRGFRKYPIQVGDKLYLYTGLRSKDARKLREGECLRNRVIKISRRSITIQERLSRLSYMIKIRFSDLDTLNRFAREDGFKDWVEMKAWWLKIHGLPWTGNLIEWI